MVISGASCASKEGQLPILKIGDQWTYKVEYEGIIYSVITEVTEEDELDGRDCYVIELLFQPALEGIVESMTRWMDKATTSLVKAQFTGVMQGIPTTQVMDYTYKFPDEQWWPLEVGKEIRVIETLTTTNSAFGKQTTDTESTYEVVRMEKITVAAGTFKCFKIVEYNTNNKRISETWYSDDVKNDVKYIDYESGETTELKSYSVD